MNNAAYPPWKYVVLWLRLFFALHLLYSGLRFAVFGEVPAVPGDIGALISAMENIGLYQTVKYLEIVFGFMLLFNIAIPLVLILEMPTTVIIFYLNTFIAGTARQLFTGPQELFLNGGLLIAYGGYYMNFLRLSAPPRWLWDGPVPGKPGSAPKQSDNQDAAGGNGIGFVLAATAILILAVIAGSTGLGQRDLRPYDMVPLTGATLLLAGILIRDLRNRGIEPR